MSEKLTCQRERERVRAELLEQCFSVSRRKWEKVQKCRGLATGKSKGCIFSRIRERREYGVRRLIGGRCGMWNFSFSGLCQ